MSHTRHEDAVWAAIRSEYLDGQTQQRLAERYGVGRSTIRDRARREGWRRNDQPPPAPTPIEADPALFDAPMRPVVAVVADAYRMADVALRRGRPAEAQRCLAVARGFERLMLQEHWLQDALNDHWDGEADAAALSARPPWPEGIADVAGARAELKREHALFDELLNADPLDPVALAAGLDRAVRLKACLDLVGEPEAEPPQPPQPSNENDPAVWADGNDLPIPPSPCYEARE